MNNVYGMKNWNNNAKDCDAVRASASCNLEPKFMEVAGHRVFTMPYTNVYALVEEMAAIENSTQD